MVDRDPLLGAGVAVADGDGLVLERVAVDGEAEGAAGLIHAGVALADRLLGVGLDEAGSGKSPGSNLWHFAEDCSRWPTDDYLQLELQPDLGELCSECKAKQLRIKVH